MKVSHLEEIKRVAKLGPIGVSQRYGSKDVRIPEIWELYIKWCKKYKIFNRRNKYNYKMPLALKGYKSKWRMKLETRGMFKDSTAETPSTEAYSPCFQT